MFKVKLKEPFMNCEFIHPLQQKRVKELLDCLSRDPSVNEVRIFGSSVTNRCHVGSDVDVYVDMDYDHYPLDKALYFKYDLWHNFSVDKYLMNEIENKGVTVYERE